MILLLEVRSGPSAGKGVRLRPGESIRIGRTAKSDFVFPADSHLSGAHFEVALGESDCRIRDQKSTNGTELNGERISEAVLHDGDRILAGETVFRVTLVAEDTPISLATPPLGTDATPQQRLLALLRHEYQPLYAIMDAACDTRVLALLTQSKDEHQSLYEGEEGEKLSQLAPYLVRLGKDSLLLGSLVLEGWGNSWGVYLTCASEFQEVRRHLRRFFEAELAEGKQAYFRFYDPRVLRVFLPTCTVDQTNQFFGPVKYYLVEGGKPEKLLQFVNTGQGLDKKVIDLSPSEGSGGKTVAVSTQESTSPYPQAAIDEPKR